MTNFLIVLTGIEESKSFRRVSRLEDSILGKSSDFGSAGPVERCLVFNDGAFKLPCDQESFNKIVAFCKKSRATPEKFQSKTIPKSKPEYEAVDMDANVFGGDVLPPIPEEEDLDPHNEQDWSGAEDEGEDGVGQV